MIFGGCSRFRRLANETRDRALSVAEEKFLEDHSERCESCARARASAEEAFSMLRLAALDPEPDPHFDERLLRRVQVLRGRESLRYWSPAMVAAAVACLAVLAALQLLTRSSEVRSFVLPGGEARRMVTPETAPQLHLDGDVRLTK